MSLWTSIQFLDLYQLKQPAHTLYWQCNCVEDVDNSRSDVYRYDYLEFTDVAGNKTRFDHKVNTEKWPLTKVFSPGPRLHFLFHSDSSNNEWGYKFRVPSCYYIY